MRSNSFRLGISVTAAITVISAGSGSAQDFDPKKFYPKDYALEPSYNRGEESVTASPSNNGHRPPPSSSSATLQQGSGTPPNTSATPVAPPTPGPASGSFLELFVSSESREHFEKIVSQLLLNPPHPVVRVAAVYHIGDFKNVSKEIESKLQERDILFLALPSVPPVMKVSRSPTWLLTTSQGQRVIEGAPDISVFLSSTGEYRLPSSQPKPAPSPTQFAIKGL